MTMLIDLPVERVDDQGRTWYAPVTWRVNHQSQYNKSQYDFLEYKGTYWDAGDTALTVGESYDLTLTSKPKSGPSAKPGSMYLDIRSAKPVDTMPEPDQRDPYPDPPEPQRPLTARDIVHGRSEDNQRTDTLPNLAPPVEGPVKGHVENIAVRIYLAERGIGPFVVGDIDLEYIRQLRDRVYRQLTNVPIATEHHCYTHEVPYVGNKAGKYGHRDEDSPTGWCMEAQDDLESHGEPTQEEE